MWLTDKIKSLDFFGYRIELNFDKKGSSHNTLAGGIVGLLIRLLMLSYVLFLVDKLMFYGDDKNSSVKTAFNHTEEGEVSMETARAKFAFIVMNSTNPTLKLDLEELK